MPFPLHQTAQWRHFEYGKMAELKINKKAKQRALQQDEMDASLLHLVA